MTAPGSDIVRTTHGYHPVTTDLDEILRSGGFEQLLVFGPGVPDVVDLVAEARVVARTADRAPTGRVLVLRSQSIDRALGVQRRLSRRQHRHWIQAQIPTGSPLDNALGGSIRRGTRRHPSRCQPSQSGRTLSSPATARTE